jgi:hypothetical protein
MSGKRIVVPVVESDDGGREPDYTDYNDAVYWDTSRGQDLGLAEGEVSIIPINGGTN